MKQTWLPDLAIDDEAAYFGALATLWLERTRLLHEISVDVITRYEDFTANPGSVLNELRLLVPDLREVSPYAVVDVKDYPSQPLRNMNASSISYLSDEQLELVTGVLGRHEKWLDLNGYTIDAPG